MKLGRILNRFGNVPDVPGIMGFFCFDLCFGSFKFFLIT